MSKETRSLDKKGFSNKFFEILDKEHDNAKIMSKRQKELKKKHKKSTRKQLWADNAPHTNIGNRFWTVWGLFLASKMVHKATPKHPKSHQKTVVKSIPQKIPPKSPPGGPAHSAGPPKNGGV